MNELKEILSALLVLSKELDSGVPRWFTYCTALGLAVAFYAWIARQVMTKEVGEFTRSLLRAVAACLTWLSTQPEQMFVGVERSLWRRPMAISVIAIGLSSGLSLVPSMWIVSQVLTLPNHPRFFWAGPVFVAETFLLFLCCRLIRAGWMHRR